jgi:hypothetical protein
MTDKANASYISSTSLSAVAAPTPDSPIVRPRNRRLGSVTNADSESSTATASSGLTPHRGASPIPSARIGHRNAAAGFTSRAGFTGRSTATTGVGLLNGSWSQTWASVQGFASSLLDGGETSTSAWSGVEPRKPTSGGAPTHTHRTMSSWGPEMPGKPSKQDTTSGLLADREAALKVRKTASVLESHEGVNGGLDVSGHFKKRKSDELLRDRASSLGQSQLEDEMPQHLVYIHHVQPSDTYAGIVLRYRCREDAFRKANGLWSRDGLQVRKWLALPVDACEVKGRPCDAPSYYTQRVDLLAPTPEASSEPSRLHAASRGSPYDDFFSSKDIVKDGAQAEVSTQDDTDERPWVHVRWVKIDGFAAPVEIARMSRKSLGYFPPRRKKNLATVSGISTPRESLDVPSITLTGDGMESPGSVSSHRQSSLVGARMATLANQHGSPATSRSRLSSGGDDMRPNWMRRPGGVGSLGKTVRAPGPEKDYFNTWAKRHMPSLNNDNLPSMAIMGSETARWGFQTEDVEPAIVESSYKDTRDLTTTSRHGSGLDKAAAVIETWLRGAFDRRPGTPILGPRGRLEVPDEGDLIELADTNSDDGGTVHPVAGLDRGPSAFPGSSLLGSGLLGTSSRSDGSALVRGRSRSGTASKGKKSD